MGDKQEPNKIQECFRAIIAEIRTGERQLRKGPVGAKAAAAATSVATAMASATDPSTDKSTDPAADSAGSVAGTGTRAARALSLRS